MNAAPLGSEENAGAGVRLLKRRTPSIGIARQKFCGSDRLILRKPCDFIGIHADGLVITAPAAGVTGVRESALAAISDIRRSGWYMFSCHERLPSA
jgi:hypothetical protein